MSKTPKYELRYVPGGGNFSDEAVAVCLYNTRIAVGHAYSWDDAERVMELLLLDDSFYITMSPLTKSISKAVR